MSEGEIGQDEGHAHSLFRLHHDVLILFAQTGWILLEPGMVKATEGNPSFVQRIADGNTISHQWVSGIARILATIAMPQEGTEGTPQKNLTPVDHSGEGSPWALQAPGSESADEGLLLEQQLLQKWGTGSDTGV